MAPGADLVARFAADLDSLIASGARIGIAVSGGPDSLALLLLAVAAKPGEIEAATVNHGLRAESSAEAEFVADVCSRLGIEHAILTIDWDEPPTANVQARARDARYAALASWAGKRGLTAVATAHHMDDQAETLLMRLARGSGISGLAGIERERHLADRIRLMRPLLGWRRDKLAAVVAEAGLTPVEDPTNSDERFDRTRVRTALRADGFLRPERVAASASHLAEAEAALRWAAARECEARFTTDGEAMVIDPAGLPRELQRRLLAAAIEHLSGAVPPGPELVRALDALRSGKTATLATLKLSGGPRWRLWPAPPRRPTADSTRL